MTTRLTAVVSLDVVRVDPKDAYKFQHEVSFSIVLPLESNWDSANILCRDRQHAEYPADLGSSRILNEYHGE